MGRQLFELRKEQWRRICRTDLVAFATEVLASQGHQLARHHRYICRQLMMLLHGELKAADAAKVLRQLMVLLPPGAGKTTIISHLFPPFFMALRPGCRIVAVSHTDQFAEANSLAVHNIIRQHSDALGFDLASDARGEWWTTNGCHYIAVGTGATIRGRRADLMLVDDPIRDRAAAESEVRRAELWRWFNADLMTRFRSAEDGKPAGLMVMVGTPLHQQDLLCRLRREEADDWSILHLPAIAGPNDPLGRAEGEFLWADDPKYRYADDLKATLARFERAGQMYEWSSQFMGEPVPPEGVMFKPQMAPIVEVPPLGATGQLEIVRGWDLASTTKGDWTACVKLGRYYTSATYENGWIVLEAKRMRGPPDEVRAFFRATVEADGSRVTQWLPEDPGQAGKEQAQSYVRSMPGYRIETLRMTGSKEVRAAPAASQLNAGVISLLRGSWNAMFLEEVGSFPLGVYDDMVDAFSLAFGQLKHNTLAQWMRL
jgi:predicted phage terminase large subunit-like protein